MIGLVVCNGYIPSDTVSPNLHAQGRPVRSHPVTYLVMPHLTSRGPADAGPGHCNG